MSNEEQNLPEELQTEHRQRKFERTPRGQAVRRRYRMKDPKNSFNHTPAVKASKKKYEQTDKGKARRTKYNESEKGKEKKKQANNTKLGIEKFITNVNNGLCICKKSEICKEHKELVNAILNQ